MSRRYVCICNIYVLLPLTNCGVLHLFFFLCVGFDSSPAKLVAYADANRDHRLQANLKSTLVTLPPSSSLYKHTVLVRECRDLHQYA
jgi:hypothetical protein